MESFELFPLIVGLLVHAAGIAVALLSRLPSGLATCFLLRTTLLGLGVAISGLAIQSAHHGFGNWVFSASTLGIMVIAAVLHSRQDEVDPVLSRVVSTLQ